MKTVQTVSGYWIFKDATICCSNWRVFVSVEWDIRAFVAAQKEKDKQVGGLACEVHTLAENSALYSENILLIVCLN